MAVTDWPAPKRRRLCRILWAVAGSVLVGNLAIAIVTLRDKRPSHAAPSPVLEQPAHDGPVAARATGTLDQYAAVWQRNVSADFTPPPPPKPEPKPEPPPPPKLVLKALLRDSRQPVAVVAGPDGKPVVLPLGSERHGLRLEEVQTRAAVIGYEGQTFRLELPAESLPVRIEEVSLTGRPKKRELPQHDPAYVMRLEPAAGRTFLEDVRVEPVWADGGGATFAGLKVTSVRKDSAYDRAGLMPEDVIHAVAGKPITTLDDVARLYDLLLSEEELEMEILRAKQIYWLVYANPQGERP